MSDLARAIGCTPSAISKLESGYRVVGEELLLKIARTLELDSDELLLAAGCLPEDVREFLCKTPNAVQKIRRQMAAA